MQKLQLSKLLKYLRSISMFDSAHDLSHVNRVYMNALLLAAELEDIDLKVLKIAVLLHDIGKSEEYKDTLGKKDHAKIGAEMAENLLERLGFDSKFINKVKLCILTHRFRSENRPRSNEAKILFDADKLDLLGSVGIIRSFLISKEYNQKLFSNVSIKSYLKDNIVGKNNKGRIKDISKHSPNLEFELKIKSIPESLHFQRSKEIAKERIKFMEKFFNRLKKEICLFIE